MSQATATRTHPTAADSEPVYVTYDLQQKTPNGKPAVFPKVKRVHIAGDVQNWDVGDFEMRSGRTAHGVRIEYEQSRKGYTRTRAGEESHIPPGMSLFTKVVEVPEQALNVALHQQLPERYRDALAR